MAKKVKRKSVATSKAKSQSRSKAPSKPGAKAKAPKPKASASPATKAISKSKSKPAPAKKAKVTQAKAKRPFASPSIAKPARFAKRAAGTTKAAHAPAIAKVASTPAPKSAPQTLLEPKPTPRRPAKHEAPAVPPAPSEPLFPIAPPSGQRDVDLATAIQKSRMFYAGHGLGALASAIPSASEFPPEASAAIEQAHSIGLDDVFVFPPVALQRESLDHLVHRLATANSDRLAGDQQYGQPWLYQPQALTSFEIHGRPAGAYALCFYSGAFPAATSGKDASELRDWLDQRHCASLTVYEYLVLQRLRAEQHGDHRFDLNSKDAGAQWHWLLDMSQGEGKDAKYPMAGWNAKMRRIELGWCGPRDPSPGKGTHATRMVPASAVAPSPGAAVPHAVHE